MASNQYALLDDAAENELHNQRLLPLETRPFLRLTKRLLAPGSLTNPNIFQLPTPPPDGGNIAEDGDKMATEDEQQQQEAAEALSAEVNALREDVLVRRGHRPVAVPGDAERGGAGAVRERPGRILETMESVRRSNGDLRAQLDEARATLAQRKKFDELADRITGNRMLRPREEQAANIDKLTEECEELQRESETYAGTWRERKEQFDKLVDEGVNLRRMIRDEQEEVERREGMDEGDAGDEDGAASADTPAKGSQSGNATPAPRSEGGTTPMRPGSSSGRTPAPEDGSNATGDGSLKPKPEPSGTFSSAPSQAPTPRVDSPAAGTPAAESQAAKDEPEDGEDVEMSESAQAVADTPMAEETRDAPTPQITVDAPAGSEDKMDTT
ncbi:hypothetical protein KJ359_002829 [Pestalotiopsis sp. 9143b]|nr:hypothetical protein KJ359_002829 [Pestalotiopsis sp. 9143b]